MPIETLMTKVMLIDTWLEERFSIKVPVPWLKSCIQNVVQNDHEYLKAVVFKTWLYSDLHEIGCDKLPAGISDVPSITIEGSYILQVEEIMDVSQSPYDQLKKLLGKDNENVLVNCEASIDSAEKSSRILKMTVTDGFQTIFAMEYSTIPTLSVNTTPGTKIRVIGPIKCYAATLMLTKDNVVVFGGEVQHLVIKNCQKNVLARALNLKELVNYSNTSEENQNANNNEVDEAELNELMDNLDSDMDLNFIENENSNDASIAQPSSEDMSNRPVSSEFQPLANNGTNIRINEKRSRLSTKRKSTSQRSLTEFLSQPNNASSVSIKGTSDISNENELYTYLSKALEKELTEPKIVRVKAFIGSVVSKLKRNQVTMEWKLEVIINDGTMVIIAMLSHSILNHLFGPDGKKGMPKAMRFLAHCNTVMKLELNPAPNLHKVISIDEKVNLHNLTHRFRSVDLTEIGIQ